MNTKPIRGGYRPGAGRPITDRNITLSVRVSKEALDMLNRLTRNKSEYIDNLIKQQFHHGEEKEI